MSNFTPKLITNFHNCKSIIRDQMQYGDTTSGRYQTKVENRGPSLWTNLIISLKFSVHYTYFALQFWCFSLSVSAVKVSIICHFQTFYGKQLPVSTKTHEIWKQKKLMGSHWENGSRNNSIVNEETENGGISNKLSTFML